LRRLLEAPEILLDNQARQERQNLLARYPQFAELSKQSRQLRQELIASNLVPKNNEEQVALQKKWDAWVEVVRKQESLLRAMAVDRNAVGVPFPPLIPTKQIRQQLPPGTVLWTFFAAGNEVFVFYVTNDQYDTWQLRGGQVAVQKLLTQYLTQLGFLDGNREFTVKDVTDTGWQSAGANLLNFLVAGSKADLAADFDQLIIVPDGFLWYLPFEALCVKADNGYLPLVAKHKIYYSISSTSAVMGASASVPPQARTLVFQGRLNPQEEAAVGQQRVSAILESLPGALVLRSSPSAPPSHLVASLFDQLVVLEDLGDCARPFNLTPLPLAKVNSELGEWLELPYGRPFTVALPGLHMATESALRKNDISLGGQEVFLAAASLQAMGSQTLLLGRWRTGGQSLNRLLKEFFQEWPEKSASESLQRAMLLVMTEPLDPGQEPRVQIKPDDPPAKMVHPLFWANLLLVDAGRATTASAEPPGGNNPPAPAQGNPPAAAPGGEAPQEQANPPGNANKDQ
jgi:hypothetical protein